MTRRFPAPWTAEEYRGISYIVRDANRFAVANLMTKDEAPPASLSFRSC
jgi:hypothetical protein